jgi:hypothetical protein
MKEPWIKPEISELPINATQAGGLTPTPDSLVPDSGGF